MRTLKNLEKQKLPIILKRVKMVKMVKMVETVKMLGMAGTVKMELKPQ